MSQIRADFCIDFGSNIWYLTLRTLHPKYLMMTKSFIFLAALAGCAFADTVTLRPVGDTTIYYSPGFETSNSKGEHLFIGNTGGGQTRRGLMKFDIAGSLPPDAQITGVEFRLGITRLGPLANTVSVYRCLTDWAEGTSDAPDTESGGAPATPGDPSWNFASFSTRTWNLPGGDFNNVPRATMSVAGLTSVTLTGPGLSGDVASWLTNPSLNFGWFLQGDESMGGSSVRFGTRENLVESDRPFLLINYSRACPADFNWDATVDFFDYLDFVQAFSQDLSIADFNGDAVIDFFDYLDFVAAFAEGC